MASNSCVVKKLEQGFLVRGRAFTKPLTSRRTVPATLEVAEIVDGATL